MPDNPPSIEFARALLALKQRTGRGYRDLASEHLCQHGDLTQVLRRKGVAGGLRVRQAFGRLVGIRANELNVLYQLWLRAQLDGGPARQ